MSYQSKAPDDFHYTRHAIKRAWRVVHHAIAPSQYSKPPQFAFAELSTSQFSAPPHTVGSALKGAVSSVYGAFVSDIREIMKDLDRQFTPQEAQKSGATSPVEHHYHSPFAAHEPTVVGSHPIRNRQAPSLTPIPPAKIKLGPAD